MAWRRFDPPSLRRPFAPSAVYDAVTRYFGILPSRGTLRFCGRIIKGGPPHAPAGMLVARYGAWPRKTKSKRAAKRTLILRGGKKKKAGRRSPPALSEKVPYRN